MKTRIITTLFAAVLLFGAALPTAAAPLEDTIDIAVEIIVRINTYREELGLPPYTYDATLMAVAQAHTEYQASIEESTHKGAGDSTSSQRAAAGGYADGNFAWVNEMIYHGQYATPEKAVAWWKDSPIHNDIMTSDQYHQIGVGVVETETFIYYTVNVGAIPGVTSAGTPGVLGPDVSQVRSDMTGGASAEPDAAATEEPTEAEAVPVDAATQPGEAGQTEGETTSEEGTLAGDEVAAEDSALADVQPAAASQTNWNVMIGGGVLFLVVVGAVVVFGLRGRVSAAEMEALLEEGFSEFYDLPRQEQFNRLQVAARQALEAYPLEVIGVEPLRYVLNAEFLVTAYREGSGERVQVVVRVNAPGFHTAAEVTSELAWLAALNQDTDLKVPRPLRTRRGDWVETVASDLLDGPRHCVVFEYIPGHTIEAEASARHLSIVGALIARLHRHGASFDPPEDFTRKHWDLDGLKGGMLDVAPEEAYAALTEEELRVVRAAEKVVAAASERLGRGEGVYGLIHADLHLKSFLFNGDELMVLDFDTCGYGYYIYDLAVVVGILFEREDFALLRKALLEGYREVRPLSELEEGHLVHFIAGRLMAQTLAWAARRDDPGLAKQAEAAIKRQIRLLEMLIRMYAA